MKQVKFRKWQSGKMIQALQLNSFRETDCDFAKSPCHTEIMIFIGIADSNGIDIYDEDIVRCIGGEEHQGYHEHDIKGVVKFSYGSFAVVTKDNVHYDFSLAGWDTITIIGNSFQNPELL